MLATIARKRHVWKMDLRKIKKNILFYKIILQLVEKVRKTFKNKIILQLLTFSDLKFGWRSFMDNLKFDGLDLYVS